MFEILVMTVKQIMTGALGVLKPGSPNQMVAAVLTMFIYLMVLLRLSPFKESADDAIAFVCALGTVLMTMIGLLMNLDERPDKDPNWKHFNPDIMGKILIGITAVVSEVLCRCFCKKKHHLTLFFFFFLLLLNTGRFGVFCKCDPHQM